MHVQAVKSKRKGKTYLTYLVKQSYRTPKGPRSRTICNITGLPAEVRDLIKTALKGKPLVEEDLLQLRQALDFGGLAVLREAWEQFGLDGVLEPIKNERAGKLIKALVMARILFPGSKVSLAQAAEQTLLAQACDLPAQEPFAKDDLYRAMDALNGQWAGIEQGLYEGHGGSISLVLYDLSSVYFEGQGPEGLAHYGYSRDHRGDRKQVLLAVATTAEGVPLHLEVLKGNRGDNKTLPGLLETLRRRFSITEVTFCFDGGISTRLNLEAMEADELRYVTRQSDATLKALLKKLPQNQPLELWDRTKLMEFTLEGKRYVVASSPFRAERDRQRRQSHMDKSIAELQRLGAVKRKKVDPQKLASQIGRALQRLQGHQYFAYQVSQKGSIQWSLKTDTVEQEAAIDGLYLLTTNLESSHDKETIHNHYKNLMRVEEAFRELKSYLKVRPVFHYRPDRVRNHIRICFLAYWLSARIAQQWKLQGFNEEVTRTLRRLQKIRLGTLALGVQKFKQLMAEIPASLNEVIQQINCVHLFQTIPKWARSL